MRIFLAGAAGVIGRPIEAMCGRPVIVDVFDADALKQAVVAARPDIVVHQLTDFPDVNDPAIRLDA